ncbi:MAG: oligopeptide transporter, OPT family [Myxococcaceae bacterium]|nr:oligopeptide transporter, OPT family [Myxococcaceae bacterium]
MGALVLGSALGIIFAASSVYLAVKVGMTVSASIPIAVLSIAIFRALGKSSILKNTIVQTTGSAGESLAFGVAAALPALLFLGYDIDLTHALLVASLGGILGVLMMIPLRHGLIVQEHGKLAYPEGTACADVLIAGEQGGTNARTVLIGFLVGGLYKLGYSGLKLWRETVEMTLSVKDAVTQKVSGYVGGSIATETSPELLGVGYIIGPRVAGITFAGGVLSYLVLIPAIKFFASGLSLEQLHQLGVTGDALVSDMSPGQVRNAFVLYIGAGAVATGGLISLIRSFPTIINAFKRGFQTFLDSRAGRAVNQLRTEKDLPITVVIFGSVAMVLMMWLAPMLHLHPLAAILILVFGFFFVTVSARITGEIGSSSNPISGMVVATLLMVCLIFLFMGWTSPSDRFMALTTAAIVGIAASNGGTTAQDLKTAYLVGGTPYRQQIALFVGVLTSASVIGLVLVLLNQGYSARIPESYPGITPEHPTEETVSYLEFSYTPDAAKDVAPDALARALWDQRLELRGETIRSFHETLTAAELKATTLKLDEGAPVALNTLGTIGEPTKGTLKVAHARGQEGIPNGRYLLGADGAVQYVDDPGIGGRINEYLGKKLTRFDAPKARLFSLIIDGILTQKLPWTLVLLGVFIALMLELCGVAALPFAVGVYLPISTSAPIFVGGMVRHFIDRKKGVTSDAESEFSPGTLVSSGLIAGGAIAGVIVAMMQIPADGRYAKLIDLPHLTEGTFIGQVLNVVGEAEENPLMPATKTLEAMPKPAAAQAVSTAEFKKELYAGLWGLFVFLALTGFLFYQALRGKQGAGPPAKAAAL